MAYLEPHEEIWKKETGQWYNIQQPADEADDTFTPFNGLNGFSFGTSYFHGTFFRFPLRGVSREKRVSSHVYTVSKLREILTALREEARVMLLFLRKVRVIRVHEISKRGSCTDLLRISSVFGDGQQQLKSQFHQQLRSTFEHFSYNITRPIQCTIKFKVEVEDYIDRLNSSDSEWLVASSVGSPNSKVQQVAEALKALPWVGVALETTESHSTGGRVFCVLPMPSEVSCHLPVHVNATFSLNDERRELKWSGIERKNDPSSDWNELIVQHLLPPCYAGLLLSHAKHVLTSDAFYRAWPEVDKLRFTHWEGLLGPLFQQIFSESMFWSHDEMWVAHDMALFTPIDAEVPDVVTAVLSSYGEKIVTLPSNVWGAINYSGLSVSQISPKIVRKTLRHDHEGYSVYNYDKKLELLQYCLSDGKIRNIIGFRLLPLANKKFASFDVNRPRTTPIYLCSPGYPSCIIPDCKNLLVDIPCSGELYESLVSLAQSKVTQLAMLDTSGVTTLLKYCLPTSSVVKLPHGMVNIQWLKEFWGWATRQPSIDPFSDLLVVPAYDPLTQEECVVRLSQDSPAVYSETSIRSDLLNVLGKFGVKCCEKSRFSFMCTLSVFLVKHFSSDGVLDAICVANHYKNVVLTMEEAASLREFLCTCSQNPQRIYTLKELAIFTTLTTSVKRLCSVNQVPSGKIEPGNFPLNPQNLPPQLILFSKSEHAQLVLLQSLSVPQPTCVDLLVEHVFPLIRYSRNCVNLMEEVLDNIHIILSNTGLFQKEELKDGIKTLPFLPVVKHSLDLHKPTTLFNPSDPLLQKLFKGKPVFPVEPFHSEKSLAVLKSCGLKTKVSQQELVDLILEITASAGKEIRYVDSTIYTKAKAILEYIGKWTTTELSRAVIVHSKRITFSRAVVGLARLNSWLPVKAAPTQDYPEQLLWKGGEQSQHLVSCGVSTILCHNNQLLELACGSQVYFVDHSLPVEICQLFNIDPNILVKHVIAHLGVIVNSSKLSLQQVKTVTQAVYQVLNKHIEQTICIRALLPTKCIFISRSNVFVPPSVVAVQQNVSFRRNLEPFIYTLPDDLYPFAALFKSIGVEECISKQQIIGILEKLKGGSPENLGIEREDAWELVMTILNWLTGNGEHPVDVSDSDSLYVPIEDPSSDWPILEESEGVVYTDNDFLRRYIGASDGEHYKFVNHRIPPQMAQLLHLTPLSKSLDVAEDAFKDVGHCEPLTVRLQNILKDYKDGLTIIKELLQNADDAGATEVNICYDARDHTVSGSKLLFPGMASCHGPALVVHNNAVFTQDDFKNITKLAGATKEGKTLKIGKFGVGFCSVYHMTDVPSFISNQYLYIFDPTLACLKDDIKNPSQPGKKVTHCTKMVMNSEQLLPYQGLFEFQKGHPYKGTMFRFPFRTTASELSGNVYTSNVVNCMFNDIQRNGSELLLFLQQVKCIKVHVVGNGGRSPQVQVVITKEVIRVCDSINIVKICCSTGCTTYWLVATHSNTVLSELATASVACSLSVPTPYTPQSIEGEVFCFLPLSVKTGLPVHISSNFAVTNNRTGLWTSDNSSTDIKEVKWNRSLMITVIPSAYLKMLASLKKMSRSSEVGEYVFYTLWPLKNMLTIHNPWKLMVDALYQEVQQSDLFFSNVVQEWLSLSKGRFLSPGILSYNPIEIPTTVQNVAAYLNVPIIDLPHEYYIHLIIKQFMISEEKFLQMFFGKIDCIEIQERNKLLCLALECYATELDRNSARKLTFGSCLSDNACIPCTPDGNRLRKCSEVISPRAEFAGLFDEDEGIFPIKSFHEKPLVSKAMEVLGIVSSQISMEMLKDRARTICSLYKDNKDKALKRTRLILNCLGSYSVHYEEDEEIASIPFLPVMPKPKEYFLSWFGDSKELFSGKELVLKGETSYLGNKKRNLYVAGSQVPFTNELQPDKGGCGYLNARSREILKVRETPTLKEVFEHFKHVIHIFNSQKFHSQEMITEIDAIAHSVYKYFDNVLMNLNPKESNDASYFSALLTHPCIWTGVNFICCQRVAKEWKTSTGSYLYRVPDGHYTHLWNALGIKDKFTANDLIRALKEIADTYGSTPVPENLLNDIISELRTAVEDSESYPIVMLPDEGLVMHTASSLAFNDAQWLAQEEGIQYVKHHLVTRDLALKLGVKMVRNKILEAHRQNPKPMILEGKKFGQHEELTTRLQGILKDYPFDVTILKELLQNADDSKATKMYVILDKRMHSEKRVLSKHWQELQGPALLVWNDSVFSQKDFEGIQKLGRGNKQSDAKTIGQYGIGFNSVYHLTDCPSFITAGSLCIFDPHCKYTPDSSVIFPGEKFTLTEKFWSDFPDMKPAYLHSNVNGPSECIEVRSGSLFRFPLRHTQELVKASEIVNANLKNFEGVVTADKMHNYLLKWAPQMKQSLFFLNHVTELKFFVIHESSNNSLKLEHHYQVKIDSSAITKRSELHQKIIGFNGAGSDPFVTKYQLTLTEGKGSEEQWLIQRGVGDIYNKHQKWKFVDQVKPRHGIAVPLKPATDPLTFRGKVFCFLPLPLECNLPVHINGHFILHSSRQSLWKADDDDNDSKHQWNTALLKAIASSYAMLLMTIKADYKILSGEVHLRDVEKYYKAFPSWTAPSIRSSSEKAGSSICLHDLEGSHSMSITPKEPTAVAERSIASKGQSQPLSNAPVPNVLVESTSGHSSKTPSTETRIPLPTNEWLILAENVFKRLATMNAPVIAVTHKSPTKKELHTIEWCPLKDEDPASQVYFVGSSVPNLVIEKIGMKLTRTKHWVRKHFEHIGCSIPTTSPTTVYEYYEKFHQQVLPVGRTFPCPLRETSLKSVEDFKIFFDYIAMAIPSQTQQTLSSEDTVAIEQPVVYPPLLVTADGMLRYCNEESDKVISSSFSGLFQKCLHFFLHSKLVDAKIPKHFLLTPSEENKDVCIDKIDLCLTSVLPDNLMNVTDTKCSEAFAPLITNIWRCFSTDVFFKAFLRDILEKWALLLAKNATLYSCYLRKEAVLPIIPPTVEREGCDHHIGNTDNQISFETCAHASSVCQHLDLPFLDTEIVPFSAVKGICPMLSEPSFMLQVLHNFHHQFDISKYITKDKAKKLLSYFGNIHLKKDQESLGYLKQLPLFQTHQGNFTSLTGKLVYQWPSQMCSDGQDIWLKNNNDVVFLDPWGSWSELGLHGEFQVCSIHPIEIYCQFVFPNFGDMNESLRYKHLYHIKDSVFEEAKTHSEMRKSPMRQSSVHFIYALKCLPCIGRDHHLRAVSEFYDNENIIFYTFRENFQFLPEHFRHESSNRKWKNFLKELGFHFYVTATEFLDLCQEMANNKHVCDTTEKSSVLFKYLFERETQEWFTKTSFLSGVVNIPFVLADKCVGYRWIAKTPPENHASGTCKVETNDDGPVYLTQLKGACIYNDVKLVWSVKPVYHVPQQSMNPTNVLGQLNINFIATVSDVVHHLITISETGRSDPRLFDSYTAPLPSAGDERLIDVTAKCFNFLSDNGESDGDVEILKMTTCIPVPTSDGDRNKIVFVKPSQTLMTEHAKAFFPYLHQVPYELMASRQLLERIGVKDSIQLSHIQLVLNTIHDQLNGTAIDPNLKQTICLALSHLVLLLPTSSGKELSPLYLPGRDKCMHHTSTLVYPDSYSYKECKLPESANYVLLHHPDPQKDQFDFANQFCTLLPEEVRPIPLSKLCCQTIKKECTSECEDIDMARCLKVTLRLEQLPSVCISTFKKYAKDCIRLENAKELLSSLFQGVHVKTVKDLEVELAMKNRTTLIGTANVEFYLSTSDSDNFCLYLDSKITRMLEEHIHKTMVQELLGAINKIIGTSTPGIVIPKIKEAFCLFLKSQTNEELHKACKISGIELEDLDFVRELIPNLGHPIPKEWHYMLDQNPENVFHAQEIVGYETSEGNIIFAQVLYAIPPEDLDLSQDSTNPLLNRYKIALLDEEINVTALEIFKFVRERRESLAIANTDEQEEESVKEGGRFSNARAAKRHLCQLLKQIWRMSEPERSRAIRRLYLQWHPDKNLNNVELANEVFTFLKRQIERLEQGLDPEEVGENEIDEVSPSPQWRERYRAWNETASTHTTYRSRHTQYTRSNPSWGGVGVGTTGSDWQAPKPNLNLAKCWVKQAEHDYSAMVVLFEKASTTHPKLCSHVCFMAHEVAEKALKGGMYATCGLNEGFLANHQISLLANALRGERMDCAADLPSLTQPLVRFYLDTRFPNRCPGSVPSDLFTTADAQQACENAMKIFTIVRNIVPTC